MRRFARQSGFTLMESIIGLGLLMGLGVVGLKLSQSMKQSSTGIRKMSAMSKVMIQMRTMTMNAEVCSRNFAGKAAGEGIDVLMDKENKPMMKEGSKMENDTVMIKEMRVEKLMPERKRAQVSVLFERMDKEGRAAHSKKVINIMANIQSGRIVECLDFGGILDDSLVNKLCWDADPENFDAPPNDNFDCADNVAHLVAQVKDFYCRENGLIGDPATGVCRPLDSNMNCPSGTYLRGFLANGSPDCYTPEPPDPVDPNPTPSCWEAPTAAASCTVAGPCSTIDETRAGECNIAGTWTATTLTCKASSANCSIYKEKTTPPSPSLCWQLPDPNRECLISGSCSSDGARQMTKCKDAMGNFQAGYNLLCAEVDPLFCVKGGSCDPNKWDSTKVAADICTGSSETQTNECGGTRKIDGEKTCSAGYSQTFQIQCGCAPFRQKSVTYEVTFSSPITCNLQVDVGISGPISSGRRFTIQNRRDFSATLSCTDRPIVNIVGETMCGMMESSQCE